MTVPVMCASEPVEGNICTTRSPLFISWLFRSWTLLVRSHFQWVGGKPR